MTKKLFIKTYGCQMNEYDSLKIIALLAKTHAFITTEVLADADLIIFNTCSIREKAQEKLFSDLGRIKKLKIKNPQLIIAVGGCVAASEKNTIFRRAPIVDIVFGPQTLHKLPQFYDDAIAGQHRSIDVSFPSLEKFEHLPELSVQGTSASVSIMEGCNKFCSYCIVPYTRGRECSRPFDDVIAETKALAAQGAKEITLLGQNVNNYRGITASGKIANLADLLYACADIASIKRLRFMTSHPANFDDSLIKSFMEIPKLADLFHLPAQSGSNRILKAMHRGYTREDFLEKIAALRAVRPNISISTDLIVGFPGETDEDFADTMDLVYTIGFDHSYSFIYSPRPGTKAATLADNVSLAEKKQRLEVLQQAIRAHAAKISESMVGTTQTIIVTGCAKKDKNKKEIKNDNEFLGYTENNRVVSFKIKQSNQYKIGDMIKVKITSATAYSLRGENLCNLQF